MKDWGMTLFLASFNTVSVHFSPSLSFTLSNVYVRIFFFCSWQLFPPLETQRKWPVQLLQSGGMMESNRGNADPEGNSQEEPADFVHKTWEVFLYCAWWIHHNRHVMNNAGHLGPSGSPPLPWLAQELLGYFRSPSLMSNKSRHLFPQSAWS